MPKHSQLPKTREYQVIKTVIDDAISHVIPTRGIAGAPRYGAGVVALGERYQYKSPDILGLKGEKTFLTLRSKYKFDWLERGMVLQNIRIRIQEAYAEINKELAELIVAEYKMLIKQAGAMARGESDSKSLINALHVVQDPKRPFDFHIEVVNQVWLYQEYGYDMDGQTLPLGVAKKIFQWAVDKGIVGVLRSRHDIDRDARGRKRYKYAIKQRVSKYYERVDAEYVMEEEDEESEGLVKFMFYLAKLVVAGNTNKDNGRLFLTTAFQSITADKTLTKSIERKYLLAHRVVTK